ncbi:MAG TPA: A/G-specific adenine glycosylase [Flavisolibacter sp.]|nr:A/G-specific adenine glycosylase [Flavisolibacter sp.]
MKQAEPGSIIEPAYKTFVQNLLSWNKKENKRQMPWKGEKDPYKIWLSEIILQQTRVEQGLKYYENFINTFPDIQALAKAPEEKVFKLWEGLGYYSRCRNIITTAKYICNDLGGTFPTDLYSILQLKGIGPYTAAAIASFAFNLPFAVLDGNVFRVLSRIFDIETPIDSAQGKKEFAKLAQEILPLKRAGEYNQAIMDFGALICKPVPECSICFFKDHCKAFAAGKQLLLPVKEKRIAIKERWLNYVVVKYKNEIAVHQRKEKDIWQQLFEFSLIETGERYTVKQILQLFEKQFGISEYKIQDTQVEINQKLTHQLIHFRFITISLPRKQAIPHCNWIPLKNIKELAFPQSLKKFAEAYL